MSKCKTCTMADGDITTKFVDMTKDFKTKVDTLMTEVTAAFSTNLSNAIKNYTDMQSQYFQGFTGISNGAQQANIQLLESYDKNFNELKANIDSVYNDTQTKASQAIDSGTGDFKTQCEQLLKKFPVLPEDAYKSTLKSITDSKGKVTGTLEKQYKEVIDKLQKNYLATKKELTMPEMKAPKIPALDISPGLLEKAKDFAVNAAKSTVKTIVENKAGTSGGGGGAKK